MAKVDLVAIHHIIRSKDEIAPGKSFAEEAVEAERLVELGAAKYDESAEVPAQKKPKKATASDAPPEAPTEPELGDEAL